MRGRYRGLITTIILTLIIRGIAPAAAGFSESEAVRLSKEYLASSDSVVKTQLLARLDRYQGDIDRVIALLRPVPPSVVKRGFSGREEFLASSLQKKYPGAHIYYFVPDSYDPTRPAGLIIFMHGGGTGTRPEAAEGILSLAVVRAGLIDSLSYIVVAPSAPPDPKNASRWTIPGADDYISAVIGESMGRFTIDPNRVVLAGHSMGGMGAYCLGLRMTDRFSAVLAHSGSWTAAYWRGATGTPFFIIHGARDAVPPGDPFREHRPKYTDTTFARVADSLLTARGLEHVYTEHPFGHSFWDASREIRRFGLWMTRKTRDPYQKKVVAVTPADGSVSSPDNRWVTILSTGEAMLDFDGMRYFGRLSWEGTLEDWNGSGVVYTQKKIRAGVVEAENIGNNRIAVRTENVRRFELWFHPRMIDLSRPVIVEVNGREFTRTVRPSLADAAKSLERRRDWGLVYHARSLFEGDVK